MDNLETAYNEALELLQKGHSKEEVLLKFKAFENELSPLLDLSFALFSLPKNIVPEPAMQRKYALAPSKSLWFAWLHISKFVGVSMSVMLLFSAFAFTTIASLNSNPGQTLFPVKKTTEQIQLILAYNQEQKANLQLKITQKRLNEAREVFNNPNSNIKEEQAALIELSNQTKSAVSVVSNVTKNNPKSENNQPLLNSLENITKDQQSLLTTIQPNDEIQEQANTAQIALNENSEKISEIKQLVAIASNEQALAKLNANPDSVVVLGSINKISKEEITVEKTSFVISESTKIVNESGENVQATELKNKTKVNIIGLKEENSIIASIIQVVAIETTTPEVKSASTSTIAGIKTTGSTSTHTSVSVESPAPTNPNQATGSFILEDPAPQFFGN